MKPLPDDETWHALPVASVLETLAVSGEGLSAAEADSRLHRYGPNVLPETASRPAWRRLLAQLNNILIYLLLGSAAVTAVLGHLTDTLVILLVVAANAVIGFVQEGRAESAIAGLRRAVSPLASAVRDHVRTAVPAESIVPGDLVILDPGDKVPADLRLVKARNLAIDESLLTGESVPVEKSTDPVPADTLPADRRCMAFSGTLVVAGQGAGVAVRTGSATELGRIGALLGGIATLVTPLLQQVNRFGRSFAFAIIGLAVAVFAVAVLWRGYTTPDAFLAVVGLAVAAIPEGLPAVMTIALAVGVQRMARRQAIIRRLPAVETLGSVSVICTDKTGTLTRNEMTVRHAVTAAAVYAVSGEGYAPWGGFAVDGADIDPSGQDDLLMLVRAAVLCNDAELHEGPDGWGVHGDPLEGALMALAVKAGAAPDLLRRQVPRTDEIPFDASHRFMATLNHDHDGNGLIFIKGAPERILAMCRSQRRGGVDETLDVAVWEGHVARLGGEGQRVIALAMRKAAPGALTLNFADVDSGFCLLGLAGIIDPPREEAIRAIAECRQAGIAIKMITGDHAATAAAIAAQLGLENAGQVATGHDLDRLDDRALRDLVRETAVFARTTPEHKLRIVRALQDDGEIVAMTGDGVNDAPALKRADVGIAMGIKGTEVAKEAASMVLADDNFASIVAAVREGRTVHDNLMKVIAWTLPTGGGEAACLVAAILAGVMLPLSPLHILWVNTITAVALGLTLAFEPAEANVMERQPRGRGRPIVSAFLLWRIVAVSAVFALGAFGVFFWSLERSASVDLARTLVVNLLVVFEVSYLFSIRYLDQPSLTWRGLVGTKAVILGVLAAAALQGLFTYAPFMNRMFATQPLGWLDWAVVAGAGVVLFGLLELEKAVRRSYA
jgi:magnesium-transporting ATPase (P-type)